jgi:hypothetical protein
VAALNGRINLTDSGLEGYVHFGVDHLKGQLGRLFGDFTMPNICTAMAGPTSSTMAGGHVSRQTNREWLVDSMASVLAEYYSNTIRKVPDSNIRKIGISTGFEYYSRIFVPK